MLDFEPFKTQELMKHRQRELINKAQSRRLARAITAKEQSVANVWPFHVPERDNSRQSGPITWYDVVRQYHKENAENWLYWASRHDYSPWARLYRSLLTRLGRWMTAWGQRLQARYGAVPEGA